MLGTLSFKVYKATGKKGACIDLNELAPAAPAPMSPAPLGQLGGILVVLDLGSAGHDNSV